MIWWFNIISGCFITSLGMMLATLNISDIKKTKLINKILFSIIFTCSLVFSRLFINGATLILVNYVVLFLLMHLFLTNKTIYKTAAYSIFIFLLMDIIEIFLTCILSIFFNFYELYNAIPLSLLIFSSIVSLIAFFITKIKRLKAFINKFKLSTNYVNLLFVILVVIAILSITQNRMMVEERDYTNIIYIFVLIFIVVSLYILGNINNKKEKISNQYNQMLEYLSNYENIIDEQGKKNHEYNNQLMILKGYIDDKKKLEKYLDTIITDHKTGQNFEIRQLSHFPNGGLKGMLYYKLSKIKENKIKYYLYVSTEVTEVLEKLSMNLYKDITKVFGVLIDNAIDAALDSKKKEISLDFSKDDDFIVITISNSYNKNIDLHKVGKKGFSSKGKGHGFGLKLAKEIVKKNDSLELITDFDKNYFIQSFLIDTK